MQALATSALLQSQYCHRASAGLAKQQLDAAFPPVPLYLRCFCLSCFDCAKKELSSVGKPNSQQCLKTADDVIVWSFVNPDSNMSSGCSADVPHYNFAHHPVRFRAYQVMGCVCN